jgi:uncharacterized protein (TIGR03437 family)
MKLAHMPRNRAAKRYTSFLFLLFLFAGESFTRTVPQVCGTEGSSREEVLALHRRNRALLAARPEAFRSAGASSVERDIGNIAVLENTGGIVAQRNQFNLNQRTLRFQPADQAAVSYRFVVSEGDYSASEAQAGTRLAGLGDDDTRLIDLPFAFPFFGETWRQVFVNSDGNLTFGRGDTDFSDRSLGRLTAGPPRIAPLFADLDPVKASDGVRVLVSGTRVVISWVGVPPYTSVGIGPLQTFQVRLHANGAVEFAWGNVTLGSAVVGIAPGGIKGGTSLVTFRDGSDRVFTNAIAERFTESEQIDIVIAAQRFYETHDDAYDYLVFFNNMGIRAGPSALAFEVTVRGRTFGIGDSPVDDGALYGSPRRLQAVMNLGPLDQYPRDPNGIVSGRLAARDTPLTVLGHEAGHLFLAFASVRDPMDPLSRPMLGRDGAHWSFFFNSDASLLEGNRIRDDGPGANPRFTTTATVEHYSLLDRYLMGLVPPEQAPPTFVVRRPTSSLSSSSQPQRNVSFNGERFDINIQQLIQAEGRRVPDHTVAQRRYRFAFILITAQGREASSDEIARLEDYRSQFEPFYRRATGELGAADATLKRGFDISTFPSTGVLLGRTATALIRLPRPAAAPFTVMLRPDRGAISTPASVTVPAGAQEAFFEIRGEREGVEELFARPVDPDYAEVHSRIPVLANPATLRVQAVSGANQRIIPGRPLPEPIVVRVVDSNNVPYAGLAVSASAASGGGVQPETGVTNTLGEASFVWTPGAGPFQDLSVMVTGIPNSGTTIPALGDPFIDRDAVVNAASFRPGLSPGAFATVFGASLTGGLTVAVPILPFPTEVLGTRVLVGGAPAAISFISDRQINFIVPESAPVGEATVTVESGGRRIPAPEPVPIRLLDPGIFFNGDNEGAILIAGTAQTTLDRPAVAGDVLEIYCTGLGPTQDSTRLPGLRETVNVPQVLIGGREAEILFSGLAPIYPGLYQVNARVPAGLGPGIQLVRIRFASGEQSNEVRIRHR